MLRLISNQRSTIKMVKCYYFVPINIAPLHYIRVDIVLRIFILKFLFTFLVAPG